MRLSGSKFGEALAPFDEDEGVAIEEFVEAERGDLRGMVEAVEIDVVDEIVLGGRAVFVDEREGGAGDFVGRGGAASADNAFGESGFSGAEIADQQYNGAAGQHLGDAAAEVDGFLVRGGAKFERSGGGGQFTRIVARVRAAATFLTPRQMQPAIEPVRQVVR